MADTITNSIITKGGPSQLGNATGTTATGNHNIPSGLPNSILIVTVQQDSNASSISVIWDNGGANTNLTQKGIVAQGNPRAEIWFLLNPSPGNKQIKVTTSPASDIMFSAATFYNVDQTTPFNASSPQTATGASGTNPSLNVTSAAGELCIDSMVRDLTGASGGVPVKATAQNWIGAAIQVTSGTIDGGGSWKPSTGSPNNMAWTLNGSTGAWGQVGVSLRPSTTAGVTLPVMWVSQ